MKESGRKKLLCPYIKQSDTNLLLFHYQTSQQINAVNNSIQIMQQSAHLTYTLMMNSLHKR